MPDLKTKVSVKISFAAESATELKAPPQNSPHHAGQLHSFFGLQAMVQLFSQPHDSAAGAAKTQAVRAVRTKSTNI